MRNSKKFLPLMLIVAAFSIASRSQGQQVSQAPAGHTKYMPDQRYYSHVFTHINYLLQYGELAPTPGQPSPSVAEFYVKRAGATDKENLRFIAIAQAWKSEVDPIDSQAQGIIKAIRAQKPGGRLAPGESLPTVPQSLLDLQAKRDATTLKYVADLHRQMGDDRFAALDSSLRRLTRTSFQSRSIPASTQAVSSR